MKIKGIVILMILILTISCNDDSLFYVVNGELSPIPLSMAVVSGGTFKVGASGGIPPYCFSCLDGTVDSESGNYVAPDDQPTDTITVIDSAGNKAYLSVVIIQPLTIHPSSININASDNYDFSINGGIPPYTCTLNNGCAGDPGTLDTGGNSSPKYTAPSITSQCNVTLTVEDKVGNVTDAKIYVYPAGVLIIVPASVTIILGESVSLSLSGGSGSGYGFTTMTGLTVDAGGQHATFTPTSSGTYTVEGHDGASHTVKATVIVEPAQLSINPSGATVHIGDTITFTATGGTPPYTFEILSGWGTINGDTGEYTAVKQGNDRIRVTDSIGGTSDASVKVKK